MLACCPIIGNVPWASVAERQSCSRLKSEWEHVMAQPEFDPDHTRRVLLCLSDIAEHVTAARDRITKSRALMARVDVILAAPEILWLD